MNVFDLEGSISLDTSGYKKAVNEAKKEGNDLAKALQDSVAQIKAMQSQIDKLGAELAETKAEIDKLKAELGGASKAAEENADSTADMTKEVNKAKKAMDEAADTADELGKEEKKTTDKTNDYSKSAEKAKDKSDALKKAFHGLGAMASEVTEKVGGLASAVGDTLVKATKVGVAAIGAASAGLGALTKQAVSSYSQYEQLVGGVETLFKDSSDTVLANAENAYKTAGMSANEYMDTVTSFSASLIQATGRGKQQDLEALENTLDKEYDATKLSLQDQYDETKAYWDKRIKLADSSEKDTLKEQRDQELKTLKRSNEAKLKELKAAHKEQLALAKAANNTSVTTAESLEEAARLADMAIIDMSDNANKMGTDMQSIQNAYQGFAKANYTMLDNLKLGYGGTKEEMERLLEDAEKLTGAKYDISSYADIVEAIHAIQTEMGITGTTAAEAAGTIAGSAGSMRAAWRNLVTGIADPKADLGKLISNFADSAATSLSNIMPIVTQALSGVGTLVQELAPVIAEALPQLITETLPALLSAGTQLVKSIAAGLAKAIPQLAPEVKKLVVSIANGIKNNAGLVITGLSHAIRAAVTWFGKNLPGMITMGKDIVFAIIDGIRDNLPELVSSFGDLGTILMDDVIKPAWDFVTTELPGYINEALGRIDFEGIGRTMSDAIKTGLKGIANFVDEIDWEQVGSSLSEAITGMDWNGIFKDLCKAIIAVIKAAPHLIEGIIKSIDFDGLAALTAIIFVPKLLAMLATEIAASAAWQSITGVFCGKMAEVGAEAGGAMGLGGKLVAAFGSFMLGWTIGTAIYNHMSDEIDSVLHPMFAKIVQWANEVKAVFDSVTDYASDQGEFLYDALHPNQGKFASDLEDTKSKSIMIGNMGTALQEAISENGYEGALKSGAIDRIRNAYSKYFSEDQLSLMLGNAAKDYISSSGSLADKIAFEKYGLDYSVDYNADTLNSAKSAIFSMVSGLKKHALGGITVERPVLTTSGDLFGEAGREAILPLDSNTGWMNELANRINSGRDNSPVVVQEVNINFPEGLTIGSDYDTDRMIERISEKLEQLRMYQNTAIGGVNW